MDVVYIKVSDSLKVLKSTVEWFEAISRVQFAFDIVQCITNEHVSLTMAGNLTNIIVLNRQIVQLRS